MKSAIDPATAFKFSQADSQGAFLGLSCSSFQTMQAAKIKWLHFQCVWLRTHSVNFSFQTDIARWSFYTVKLGLTFITAKGAVHPGDMEVEPSEFKKQCGRSYSWKKSL